MCKLTKELFRQYNQEFLYDPDIFMDIQKMPTYVFSETASDASYERQIALGRLHMAIMLETEPIGEIIAHSEFIKKMIHLRIAATERRQRYCCFSMPLIGLEWKPYTPMRF